MTWKTSTHQRLVAAFLSVAIAGYWVPATAVAGAAQPRFAEIRGNVFSADALTPVAGVSVKAAHMDTRQIYSSGKTTADGVYILSGLPAGSYDLAVETPQGLYAADMLVAAGAGGRLIVSMALRPEPGTDVRQEWQEGQQEQEEEKKEEESKPEEGAKEEGKQEPPAQPEPQPQKKKKGGGFWRSSALAAVAIVVGGAVIGVAANRTVGDDDEDEEPMTPGGN